MTRAEPVPLIFSCDTEDYETPAADDAELLWAQLFKRHGIRACFCVVGEEARSLRDRGRRDVLAALAEHEIASHSNRHSAHPTPAEYLNELPWQEGVQRFLAEEAPAAQDLNEILGQQPGAWCKPGNSWGPMVPHAAARLGMPVFCDAPLEWAPGRPLWYAGGLLLKYHTSFDRYFRIPAGERQQQMRDDFAALLDARQVAAERAGQSPGAIVMYTHPCRTLTAAFPDNFTAGKNPDRSQWRPSPLRPPAEAEALVRDFDAFLAWIAELRAGGRVVVTGYRELYARFRQPAAPWLASQEVVSLAGLLAKDESAIEPRMVGGHSLSPAEQLGLVLWALAHYHAAGRLPDEVPVRRLLGPLDPIDPVDPVDPVDRPGPTAGNALLSGASVPAGEVVQAAAQASERCSLQAALPAAIQVGHLQARPGRFMRLAAGTLVVAAGGRSAGTEITMPRGGEAPELATREDVARLRYQGTWSIFPPEFRGDRLLAQVRSQTWSAKPA